VRSLPEPIGGEVRRELGRFGPQGAMGEIVAAWPAAVGPAIAANAWPARVARDGTLHVSAASSAWAFELTQLSSSILARLREHLGDAPPSGVRFTVGPLPELQAEGQKTVERTVSKPTEAQRAEGTRIASEIEGEELRKVVARAAASSLAASSGRR
jgi:Dna[CI] antecedent DciA-like protein